MPAKSVAQRRFMGMVRATQKGEMKDPSPEVRDAAKDMSVKAVRKFAKTIEEGMSLKDFKANRQKNKRRESSADAEKRGHVGKEWHNTGRKYSPDEAKRSRANMDDEERRTRHRSAVDPDNEDDNNYSADKTKNPKKLRKQKAMGESMINERRYVSKHRPPAGWKPYGGYEKEKPEVNATANRIDAIRKSIKTKKEEVEQVDEALTGERYKKAVKKPGGTAYSRMVSADPKKRATRGGRGGESDFGAGDRGSGNKAARRSGTYKEYDVNEAARRAGTYQEEEFAIDEGLSGERYKKALKKGKMYSRMVSADPSKRATRGGRGGESDFGAGDRGSGNKAARRSGTYQEETIVERGDHWHPDPEQDRKLGGPGANQRAREDRAAASKPAAKKEDPKKLRKGESYMDYAKRQKGLKEDAPTMSAGDGGFGGSADANGPTAGFDPPMTGLTTKKPRKFCNKKNKTKRC